MFFLYKKRPLFHHVLTGQILLSYFTEGCSYRYQGTELQCLLKVKEALSQELIFQHAVLNTK